MLKIPFDACAITSRHGAGWNIGWLPPVCGTDKDLRAPVTIRQVHHEFAQAINMKL